MKNILVPVDFSQEAYNAIEVACALARVSNGKVLLFHVIDAPSHASSLNVVRDYSSSVQDNLYIVKLIETAKERLAEVRADARYAGIVLTEKVTLGNIFSSIQSEAAEKEVDMIVMGSKGTSGIDEFFIGSNTEKVVRRVKCPVLTVKQIQEEFVFKNIVFATNLSEDQGIVLNKLKRFQELFGSTIHILTVITPDHFEDTKTTRKRMNDFVQKYQLENFTLNIYNSRIAEDGIIAFAEEINADIIAMGTHGRTGIAHLINGSIAEDVVNHAKRQVLTINMSI